MKTVMKMDTARPEHIITNQYHFTISAYDIETDL